MGTNTTNAEGFGAAQQTVSLGPCSNVNDHIHSQSSSPLKNPLGSLEEESVCSPVPIQKARQYFKKRPRKLCRQLYRGGRTDRKISSVDHANYLATRNTVNPPSTVASHIANRGHSPTKEEVKKANQRLLEENLRLKKDFHKANHRLKTLLADKRDLLRRLRLESKTSNNLIESIQAEANDTINRARDILAEANRTKIQTELLKDEIDMSQNVLLRERNDLRTQSAWLKKQVARMTETHKRRKTALADQRKEMERDVNTEKQRWNISIRLAEKKMLSSLKQLQAERVMWQVLSQEVEVRCKDAVFEVHRQKSNSRTLVQMQVDKAIRKESELKSYMLELKEIHAGQLLKERQAKCVAIKSSKYWKKVATNRSNKITKLHQQSSVLKDELARVTKELDSNLVMTETMTLPTQFELKQVGRGGKWQPWVIQYICELLVIGTPPASIPSIISTSYQTYYSKEPNEVPQVSFVRQCRVIVQVIGETIAAIKLASAEKWDQLWTDVTTRRQCPFQALIIGLMYSA